MKLKEIGKLYKYIQGIKRTFVLSECIDCSSILVIRKDVFTRQKNHCKFCNKNPKYKSREYNSWDAMIQRCNNKENVKYSDYGGRGISVCSNWLVSGGEGFRNFYKDMGDCPEGMSLDRINVNGNYSKENCRWASNSIQGYNQRRRSTNTSGVTGVHWDKDRNLWIAVITKNNKGIFLGRFENFEEAVRIRMRAEIEHFGKVKHD